MTLALKSLNFAAAVILGGAQAFAQTAPSAVTPSVAVTPQAYFQLGSPSSSGSELDVYRVPVLTSTGAVVYKDVRLHFDVSAAGALSVTAGYPIVSASSQLFSGNFLAGKNTLNGVFYDLSGPGAGVAGRTSWSLDLESASIGCLISAGWTTGAVAGHPLQARLTAAKITYAGYAYGVLGAVTCSGGRGIPSGWASGDLIGAASTANGLTLYRYTDNGGSDVGAAVDSISLQKCPATVNC